MTNLILPKIQSYNYGYHDGLNSQSMKNPIHNNWLNLKHFNPQYIAGYWAGFTCS